MKKIALLAAITLSSASFAHTQVDGSHLQFSSDKCEVDFQNDVRITPDELLITNSDNNSKLRITDTGLVFIDGTSIALNAEQQQAVANYADELRAKLPQVANIALNGIKIAGVALEEVANAFEMKEFGSLSTLLTDIESEVSETFYQQGAFVMGEKTFNEFGNNFEQQFEERIEKAVEGAMMESIGSILMAIGSQMASSGGDMAAFEQRMKNMGQQIEEKVQIQAQNIEQQANALCGQFSVIARTESELQQQIPAFSGYQLFNLKQ
ncbi:YggN family protein [Pseudoalteromonas sp. S16_S37]|uniref:YggN family protein n=1 Tax=Pseudoalteromonas sp. S16_S37 TaxID=2720228 RepID=UPI001680B0F0|nr:YggN family protein [Pseudoalteromonas sp. S16_S37]MBD1582726.1 YggN family protein [Pseudoalteromonas sp. S16_S37]